MATGVRERVEVLGDPLRVGRLGDGRASLLHVPAQHHLRRALAVRLGDLTDRRVLEVLVWPLSR
jgi:hypothetical protein